MREEKYDISGMHCAACSASVERVTRKLPGVARSEVNLTTGIMTIAYDESQCTQEQIATKINCTKRLIRRRRALQRTKDLRDTGMSRLR